jgi:hypothetical protein
MRGEDMRGEDYCARRGVSRRTKSIIDVRRRREQTRGGEDI